MKNIILFFLIICCSSLYAQKMEANYQLANKYTISKLIEKYNPRKVSPYWINKNSDFIYCVKQGDNIDVFNVNPKKTEKQKLTLQIDKIDDNKYMIEQLARRHSFIDIDRVGIWGGSSGGFMAATAMLKYPEFYKVGVSRAGQHDPNIFHGW